MPVGGVQSVFFLPMSFQFVDKTVPLDSCRAGQNTKATLARTRFMNTNDRQEDHAFLMTAKVDLFNAALDLCLWPVQPTPTEIEVSPEQLAQTWKDLFMARLVSSSAPP